MNRYERVTVRPISERDGIRYGDVPADALHVMCDEHGRIICAVTVHDQPDDDSERFPFAAWAATMLIR